MSEIIRPVHKIPHHGGTSTLCQRPVTIRDTRGEFFNCLHCAWLDQPAPLYAGIKKGLRVK